MRSIEFPKMFTSNATKVTPSKEFLKATKQNTLLLLHSEKGELFGDPYFGLRLKRYLYDQNNYILRDVIIDEIYTQIALFIPQLKVERRDITITQDRGKLYCNIKGINQISFETDIYNLVLFDENE